MVKEALEVNTGRPCEELSARPSFASSGGTGGIFSPLVIDFLCVTSLKRF